MERNSSRDNNFNLLRFIFASLVIVSHAPELMTGNRDNEILTIIFGTISFGELAVDSFFVLSGYLIVKSWQTNPSIIHFLVGRILRIFPGFLVASLVCAFIVGPLYGGPNYLAEFDLLKYLRSVVFLAQPNVPEVFQGTVHAQINGSMWSIFFEFLCYLLVLVFGAFGLLRRPRVWGVLTVIFVVACILRNGSIVDMDWRNHLYIRCGMTFTLGGCFFIFKDAIPWSRKYALMALAGLLLLLSSRTFAEVSVGVLWGYCIIFYACNGKSLLAFNKLPDVSYGIYLYAWPINKILFWHFPGINEFASIPIILVFSVVAGALSWYLVEKQALRLKNYWASNWRQTLSGEIVSKPGMLSNLK